MDTLITFWLDFEGLGPPGEGNNEKKQLPNYHRFFDVEKKATQTVFCNFRFLFGVILGSLLVDFWSLFDDFWKVLLLFFGSVSGTAPGPLLAPFWDHFAQIS